MFTHFLFRQHFNKSVLVQVIKKETNQIFCILNDFWLRIISIIFQKRCANRSIKRLNCLSNIDMILTTKEKCLRYFYIMTSF